MNKPWPGPDRGAILKTLRKGRFQVRDEPRSKIWRCETCGHLNTPDQHLFCGKCGVLQMATKEIKKIKRDHEGG